MLPAATPKLSSLWLLISTSALRSLQARTASEPRPSLQNLSTCRKAHGRPDEEILLYHSMRMQDSAAFAPVPPWTTSRAWRTQGYLERPFVGRFGHIHTNPVKQRGQKLLLLDAVDSASFFRCFFTLSFSLSFLLCALAFDTLGTSF